ncbi:Uncharacterized protein APZ42_020101 [Daphnia magna]|uniref:Uncharacterized protein n=1 Tax=Daphnia magna TaxID=35525 RepID=A0A0P6A9C8_9CRUS|nr:Uncharacterized protein APZ42_020101 [Daphnia magna]
MKTAIMNSSKCLGKLMLRFQMAKSNKDMTKGLIATCSRLFFRCWKRMSSFRLAVRSFAETIDLAADKLQL